jgi:hypothetical protein
LTPPRRAFLRASVDVFFEPRQQLVEPSLLFSVGHCNRPLLLLAPVHLGFDLGHIGKDNPGFGGRSELYIEGIRKAGLPQ